MSTVMPIERRLLCQNITYSVAKKKEANILHQLRYWPKQNAFFDNVQKHRGLVAEIVSHHLGIRSSTCEVAAMDDWLHGSFNVCVPVSVSNSRKVLVRFPLPYRVGEDVSPGNSDEKVRCEAGTYAWLRQECPAVKTPHLYGFALSSGKAFTSLEHLPYLPRVLQRLRRWFLALLKFPVPSQFVQHTSDTIQNIGPYLLLEYVENGEVLSNTWNIKRTDERLRTNLFRGLSKIVLSLSRIALPRIGSFVIDDDGFLRLVNRPLSQELHALPNKGIPVDIPRSQLFFSVDSYVNSLLSYHDSRLKHQSNAVNSYADCSTLMTSLALMRTIRQDFFNSSLNHGPFVFRLTDLHTSNIFVDEDWNITCLVDLEWAASLPIEFMQTPSWLSAQPVDGIDPEVYNVLREEFMGIFEEEEEKQPVGYDLRRSDVMKTGWEIGRFWYNLSLISPTGLHALFFNRIQPICSETHSEDTKAFVILSAYFKRGPSAFFQAKVRDKEAYDEDLRREFHDPSSS